MKLNKIIFYLIYKNKIIMITNINTFKQNINENYNPSFTLDEIINYLRTCDELEDAIENMTYHTIMLANSDKDEEFDEDDDNF